MKLLDTSARLLTKKSHVFLAALLLSLPLLIAVYLYYIQITTSLKEQKSDELRSIAELKIDQLVSWRHERTFDAAVISQSAIIVAAVQQYMKTSSAMVASDLRQRVSRLFTNKEYVTVFFTNTDAVPFLGVPDTPPKIDPFLAGMIKDVVFNREITHTDFYYCREHFSIHYDILAPLTAENGAVIAVMILRVDPERFLYPYIQRWPGSSKTSETLLIKREADSIVFLNELRHKKNTALRFKISLSQKEVAATKAVLGFTGFTESLDYRGVPVLSYTTRVPDSDWFFVAKVDKDEVFAEIYYITWFAAGAIALMLLAIAFGLLWLYHYNQRNIYKKNWEKEQTHKTVLRSIGDAVITTDKKGRISFLNPAAQQLTGWTILEALKQPADTIFFIIDEETREHKPAPVAEVLKSGTQAAIGGNALLRTKNLTLVPVADSCAPIFDQRGEISGTVLVFRDQSAERLRSRLMNAHLNLLDYAADHNHHEVLVKALDELEVLTGSTIGFLHFVEPDQKTIILQAWSTRTSESYCQAEGEGLHYNISEAGIWAECVYTKAPVIHNDYASMENKKGLPAGHAELVRELVVPVLRNGLVTAIIGLGNKPEKYSDTDVEITAYLSDFIWEISEKKRIQSEREERDRKFFALFSSMNEGVALHELLFDENGNAYDYKILDVNHAFENQTGVPISQVLNRPSREAYNTDEPPYFDIYKNVALTGQPQVFETYFPVLDKYFLISVFQPGENQFGTSFQDLTQLKKADIAFRESARAFNTMIDNLSGVVYRCKNDNDWTMEYISDGIEELSGYQKSDYINNAVRTYESIIHPLDRDLVRSRIESALEMKTVYTLEYRIVNALNEVKWVWERGQGVYENNQLKTLEGFITDITQLKLAENEILHSNRLFAMLSQTNKAVVKLLDQETLFAEICRISIETGKFSFAWIGGLDETGRKLIPLYHQGNGAEFVFGRLEAATEEELSRKPCFLAVKENRMVVQNNLHSMFDEQFIEAHPELQQLRSFAATPILLEGRAQCVLAVFSSEVNFFKQKELNLLEEIGLDITFALANYKKELQRKEAERIITESEKKYSDLYENSPDMFLSVHPETSAILQCNQTTCKLTGYTKEELIGRPIKELYHARSHENFKKNFEALQNGQRVENSEMEVVKKDGSIMTVLLSSTVVFDEEGRILQSRSVWRDITEQKRHEAEEKRLWEIIKKSLNEIYIFNSGELTFRYVNEGALRNLGYSFEEILNMTPVDIQPEYTRETFLEAIKPLTGQQSEQLTFTTRLKRKDGSFYDAEVHLQLLPFGDEEVFVAMIMDISERVKAEEKLRTSDRIFEHSMDLLCVAGFDGYFKVLNPAWEKTLGWSTEELLARPWNDFVHPDDVNSTEEIKSVIIDGQELFRFENRYICKDGSVKWLAWNSHPYPEEKIMFGVAHDITSRKLLEVSIAESEERYRTLIEVSQDAIFINFDHRIIYINPQMLVLLKASDASQIIGKSPLEFYASDDQEIIKQRIEYIFIQNKPIRAVREKVLCFDGSFTDVEVSATPFKHKDGMAIQVVLRDITERIKAEETLKARMTELETFNKLSVGRELQMIELKQKINELSKQLGHGPVYNLDFLNAAESSPKEGNKNGGGI